MKISCYYVIWSTREHLRGPLLLLLKNNRVALDIQNPVRRCLEPLKALHFLGDRLWGLVSHGSSPVTFDQMILSNEKRAPGCLGEFTGMKF